MHDVPESAERRRRLRLQSLRSVLGISHKAVAEAYDDLWRWLELKWWSKDADPGFEAQIDWLRQRFDLASDDKLLGRLRAAYVEAIFKSPPIPDPAAVPLLRELRASGLRIGLICNTSVTPGWALRRLLDGWGIGPLLEVQLYSDELGLRKPAPGVFREAARQLGVEPAALLHVGDRPDVDAAGAKTAGAHGIVVGPDLPLEQVGATIAAQLNIRPSGQGAA